MPNTDWPPYLVDDPRYPGGGVLLEVMRCVAEPMGYKIMVERLPNKRGWFLLENGEVDAHAKAKEWVANPEKYLWTEPFMLHEDVLLLSAKSNLKCTGNKSLFGKRVAAIKGFIYPALEEDFGTGRVVRVDVASPFAMLDLLLLGRVDAALVNKNETLWLFANRPDLHPERFRLDSRSCDSAGYRYVFTKDDKWKPFIKKFNTEIKAMRRDGRLKEILNKYR